MFNFVIVNDNRGAGKRKFGTPPFLNALNALYDGTPGSVSQWVDLHCCGRKYVSHIINSDGDLDIETTE